MKSLGRDIQISFGYRQSWRFQTAREGSSQWVYHRVMDYYDQARLPVLHIRQALSELIEEEVNQ